MKRLLVVVLLLAGCGGAEGGSADGLVLGETAVPASVAPVPTKYHPTEPPDVGLRPPGEAHEADRRASPETQKAQ